MIDLIAHIDLAARAHDPMVPAPDAGRYASRHRIIRDGAVRLEWWPGATAAVPPFITHAHLSVFGVVRLDNRRELISQLGIAKDTLDLEIVTLLVATDGIDAVHRFVGDFALAMWDQRLGAAFLIRDSFGVAVLYYRRHGTVLHVSSRASAIAADDRYDTRGLAAFVIGHTDPDGLTAFMGVRAIPSASVTRITLGGETHTRYWQPEAVAPISRISMADAAAGFRDLLAEGVRRHHTGDHRTWAALSGGLDSSSIVSLASYLATRREPSLALGGTVTFFDDIGSADERAYARTVVDVFRVPNAVLPFATPWEAFNGTSIDTTLPDLPSRVHPVAVQNEQLRELLAQAGATTYLCGLGPDQMLWPDPLIFADLLGQGHILRSARALYCWSVSRRSSVWSDAWVHVLRPLIPSHVWRRRAASGHSLPPWLTERFITEADIPSLTNAVLRASGPVGGKYTTQLARGLRSLGAATHPHSLAATVDVRYPYLYRPLVDFVLSLPLELRSLTVSTKYVLREAMRGILPESIRTRTSKGSVGARIWWALQYQGATIQRLASQSLLVEWGYVDRTRLDQAIRAAQCGRGHDLARLYQVLCLETWLQMRAGLWMQESNPGVALPSVSRERATI